ncbi:hypothetical protein C1886_06460 [Pseudomonas sp. FW300-N1A1]|nr:hypothetical protein C1886_06460 [Pseudomonas sp. FW300-N1A1]
MWQRNLLWRGGLLPLGCAAAPKPASAIHQTDQGVCSATAPQPSGSKLPRHKSQAVSYSGFNRFTFV